MRRIGCVRISDWFSSESKDKVNELALFAGAGGGILGGKLLGWRTVCAVELDGYARRVLLARQDDGCLPPFPIWDDVRTFDGKPWRGLVDVVSGGFPCQDISVAGGGAGLDGEQSGSCPELHTHAPHFDVELAIALSRHVHENCSDVNHDIGIHLAQIVFEHQQRRPVLPNVKALKEAMGHAQVETTIGYCHAEALSVPGPLEALA